MKLRRPEIRPMPETIIALVDVAFFLLAFFMLIGRLDATAPFEVIPPLAQTGADLPAGGITISVAADGAVALEGSPIDSAQVPGAVRDLIEIGGDRQVRINAHQVAEIRHVLPLVADLEAQGIRDIVLVVSPERP